MANEFDEDQARFAGALVLADYFASWDYRCAFTGAALQNLIQRDPLSVLIRLVPQAELRADLILPACAEAQLAYVEGALRVGPGYDLIVRPGAMSAPELIERLNPTFRLRLPSRPDYSPNLLVLLDQCKDLLEPR